MKQIGLKLSSTSQVLVTGVYRSGTEYFTHLLNAHPDLHASMYCVNALRFILGKFDPLEKNYAAAVLAVQARLLSRYKKSWDVERVLAFCGQCERVTFGLLYDAIMCDLYLEGRAIGWAEKNQLFWRQAPLFLDEMPNGKVVVLIRDPRSVLASFKQFTNAPAPGYLGALFNCLDVMQYVQRYERELPKDQFFWLRHEDLLDDRDTCLARVWHHLGLSAQGFSALPFDSSQWKDAYGRPWQGNSSFQGDLSLTDFDTKQAKEGWRSVLSDEDLLFVDQICGETMRSFSYDVQATEGLGAGALEAVCRAHKGVYQFYKHWRETGQGSQGFPANPLDTANWNKKA